MTSKYMNETLTAGEEPLYLGKFDWTVKWGGIFWVAVAIILGLTLDGWWRILMALPALRGLFMFIHIISTEQFVTNKRVVVKEGLIARRTVEMRMDAIETVQVTQGVFGRMFNNSAEVVVTGRGSQAVTILALSSQGALDFKGHIEAAAAAVGA